MDKFVTPNVFISACIEFDYCRFDGTRISDDYVKRLQNVVNVVRVCPELMIGLGSPRDSLRLVQRKDENLKLLSGTKGEDYTDKMNDFVAGYITKLQSMKIDGFVMKAKSPTCGVTNVKIYQNIGKAHVINAKNPGIFGKALMSSFPDIPIETERRLSNYNIRNRFFTELFMLADYRMLKENFKYKNLVEYHTKNKYLFMTYNQLVLKKMGSIIANKDHLASNLVVDLYESELRILLAKEPTQKRRINVLTHIYGYFKKLVSIDEKEYYFDALDDYLNNKVPYSNLLYILKGWAVRFNEAYLLKQTIFNPYPKELTVVTDSGNKI